VQKLAEICIRRPIFATMIILALVVTGAAAYLGLGVDRFPSVDIPQVRVRATLAGSAPEDMETEVAQRLEEAVNTVEGLDEMRSVSGPGASFVIGNFKLERDGDAAATDVRDRVLANLVRVTPYTIVRPDVVEMQLERIRRDGVATTSEEMSLGACSLAVPVVRSSDDTVVAAIGVVVATLKRDRQRLLGALQIAARGISRLL